MDLQNIFYIVGITCMTLYTLLLLAAVVLLFVIKRKVSDVSRDIEEKIGEVKSLASNPGSLAVDLGTAIAGSAIDKASNFLKSKKKTSR